MERFANKKEKGANPMEIAIMLQKKDKELLSDMDAYIIKLRAESKPQAKTQAVKALKRTGVLTSKGSARKKIVSWE